jgi:hypothetical protein
MVVGVMRGPLGKDGPMFGSHSMLGDEFVNLDDLGEIELPLPCGLPPCPDVMGSFSIIRTTIAVVL